MKLKYYCFPKGTAGWIEYDEGNAVISNLIQTKYKICGHFTSDNKESMYLWDHDSEEFMRDLELIGVTVVEMTYERESTRTEG